MLVKKLGTALLIKTKAYKDLITNHRPLLMIASIFTVILVPSITETYNFQQPALRTKLLDIQNYSQNTKQSVTKMDMRQIYPGIGVALMAGRISNEAIVVASQCKKNNKHTFEDNIVFKTVFYNILRNNHKDLRMLAKNVVFLCYNSNQQLNRFIQEYHRSGYISKQSPIIPRFGIIRNALILQNTASNISIKQSPKIYFNIYSSQTEIHADLDFYQAIKQLLQQVGLNKWQPCRAIDQSRVLSFINKYANRGWWSLFVKNCLCQLYQIMVKNELRQGRLSELLKTKPSINNNNFIFQQSGIQAGTLSMIYNINTNKKNITQYIGKLSRLTLSFIEQFVVLEDHLHSSSTLFMPLSQSKYVPAKSLIIPGLFFLIVSAIYLILRAVKLLNQTQTQNMQLRSVVSSENPTQKSQQGVQKQGKQYLRNSLQIRTKYADPRIIILVCTVNFSIVQYLLNNSIVVSILIGFFVSKLFNKQQMSDRQKQLVKIILSGFNIFICQYFAIVCFPLSILSIIVTNLICFANRPLSAVFILTLLIGIFYIDQRMTDVLNISIWGQISLYPLLFWICLI